MKLISLHIINFGKLSNYDYQFDNVSAFCEENGFGKTTMFSFIKAMFYGLKTYRLKSQFNNRIHYYPFNGQQYGGSIKFEYNNKTYRIERIFDQTSETRDTLKVYVNDNETNELGLIPGETIFGLNEDNFGKLIAFDASQIEIGANSDINSKLNNYVENVGSNFDIEVIQKKIKDSNTKRKKNIETLKEDIKVLKTDIKNLNDMNNNLKPKYNLLNIAKDEKDKAKELLDQANKQEVINTKWANLEKLMNEVSSKEASLNTIKNKYPNGMPTNQEVLDLKNANNKLIERQGSLKGLNNASINEDEYNSLKKLFANYKPSKEDLDGIEKDLKIYNQNNNKLEEFKNLYNNLMNEELNHKFHGKDISDEVIDKLEYNLNVLNTLEEKRLQTPPIITTKEIVNRQDNKKANKGLIIGLIALSVILLGSGIGLAFISLLAGIILIVLGVVGLLATMFIYLNNALKNVGHSSENIIQQDNPDYLKIMEDLGNIKQQLSYQFEAYEFKRDDPKIVFNNFKYELNIYNRLIKDIELKKETIDELLDSNKEVEANLKSFFNKLSIDSNDYENNYKDINNKINHLNVLESNLANNQQANQNIQNEINLLNNQLDSFYNKYSIDRDYEISNIEKDLLDYNRLLKEKADKAQEAEAYKLNNNLDAKPEMAEIDIDALELDYKQKQNEYDNLYKEISDLEEQVSLLDDKNNSIQNKTEEDKELKEKKNIYEALSNELAKADQILKDKYIAPVKQKFCDYAALIEKTVGEKVIMNQDYKISFEIDGIARSSEHLSSGNLAICSLCFRLAILDNMFEQEKPFLILDDPFVNLDENHFNKTKDLLKELAKDKQIIYFCCHESRMIK